MVKRQSVFETNSSSSHSVVISDGLDFEIPDIKEDVIEIYPGDYGWGIERLRTWMSRVSYAYTYAKNYGKEEEIDTLREVIEEFTGKVVKFMSMSGKAKFQRAEYVNENFGYIDHQSIEKAETMFRSKETLKKAIFGKDSYIIIDNDNH